MQETEIIDQKVNRLIRQIGRRSPLYSLACEALESKLPYSRKIELLLTFLSSPSDVLWKERVVGAWILGRIELNEDQDFESLQMVYALSDALANIQESGKRAIKRGIQYYLSILPVTGIIAILNVLDEVHRGTGNVPLWWVIAFGVGWGLWSTVILTLFLSPFLFPVSLALDIQHVNQVRAECARSLGILRRPESISGLVKATSVSSKQIRAASFDALRKVMPCPEDSHCGQLDFDITGNLCRLLGHSDEQFVVQVLEALGKVGNGSAIPNVERLAEKSQSPHIQEAARYILPIFAARQQQEQAPKFLLRPSDRAADMQKDVLLRPTSVSDVQKEVLLRSTSETD